MSRASTKTKLPLATWAKIFGMHPLHFEQVVLETNPHCDHVYFQHEWQTADHTSREEIARAIADTEAKIEEALGYHLAPTWEVDEWRGTARPFQQEYVNFFSTDIRGFAQTVQAQWGHIISGGIESKTVIEAGATITYSDVDSDGYDETATVTVSTSVLDKNEIVIFYPGHDGDDTWEIRPINVVISGGNAVITFRRELVVVEELLDTLMLPVGGDQYEAADGTDDDDFLEEVDVYRRYNDPQLQAVFLWEPTAGGFCASCNGSGCTLCAYSSQTGCLMIRGDPRQSILSYRPGSWDSDDDVFTSESWALARQPDIVRLYYYSGLRNKSQLYTNRMDPEWERVVAYMAAAQLDRPPCDCAKGDWSKWRQDYALTAGDEDGKPYFKTPYGVLNNPFGTRRGEIYAWQKVKRLIVGQAVVV